jgi:L-alanine-DL-glutamate epimerase-like enolase superfamily enzyme
LPCRGRVRRLDGPSRGAAGRRAPARVDPARTLLEIFNADRDPIWWNLIANRPPIVDGRLTLPTGPGLGWELDGDYIDAHRVKSPA